MKHLKNFTFLAATLGVMAIQSCGNNSKSDADRPANDTTEKKSTIEAAPKPADNKIKNDNLTGFMLGGIYFIHGFGGVGSVYNNTVQAEGSEPTAAEMEKAYVENVIYPYTTSQGSQISSMLQSDWNVNNKEEFLKTEEWLLNEGHQKEFDTLKNAFTQNGGDSAAIAKLDAKKLKLDLNKETLKKRATFIKDHLSEFGNAGIKAWDIARYVNMVCFGYATGYITKEEGNAMVAKILPVARANFNDWNDYYKSYELGLQYWGEAPEDNTAFSSLIKEMLSGDKKSIYTYLSFK